MPNGTVVAICIAPDAGVPMRKINEIEAIVGQGLFGDRYTAGVGSFNKKQGIGVRQVTLMNARFFEKSGFEYHESRRNIFVRNIELMWLIGREFQIGTARMRGLKYCDPCMRPSKLTGKTLSFKDVFEDVGGLIAEVLQTGVIHLNSTIVSSPKDY